MIVCSNVAYGYRESPPLSFPSFVVKKGEHHLILGDSGSGKTTLLHLLGGLLRKYTGSVQVEGTELRTLSEHALDKFRALHMGFVFQRTHLISALTVEENLLLAPYFANRTMDRERVSELLGRLNLTQTRRAKVQRLSQGQAQRVSIARAVFNKPALLLADEPTSALDDANCNQVAQLLLEMADREGSTLLIATHDQRLKAHFGREIKLQRPA